MSATGTARGALILPSARAVNTPRQKQSSSQGHMTSPGCRAPPARAQRKHDVAITMRLADTCFTSICQAFIEASPPSEAFCVALEKGSVLGFCEYHLHVYIKFVDEWTFDELREYYLSIFPDYTFHFESVKCSSHYLNYITKEDLQVHFHGVKESYFSFYYRAVKVLRTMPRFDVSHPFIVEHRNNYKFLERLHHELSFQFIKEYCYIGPIILYDNVWFLQLFEWYRNFVSISYYNKKKHMYLWGSSNVGKTYAVHLITSYLGNRIYYPRKMHPFEDLVSDHKCKTAIISFGQSAIFLIGGKSIDDPASAVLVNSGDVMIMSGESRLCYHGVPRIVPVKLSDEDDTFTDYLKNARINLNIRQVLHPGQKYLC